MVANRNETLIYENGIGYNFSISMVCGMLWYFGYSLDTVFGHFFALIAIAGMLATALIMMMHSLNSTVNVIEWVSMRGGFSLYAGWLTAATILQTTNFLQSLGVSEATLPWGLTEEIVTIAVAW